MEMSWFILLPVRVYDIRWKWADSYFSPFVCTILDATKREDWVRNAVIPTGQNRECKQSTVHFSVFYRSFTTSYSPLGSVNCVNTCNPRQRHVLLASGDKAMIGIKAASLSNKARYFDDSCLAESPRCVDTSGNRSEKTVYYHASLRAVFVGWCLLATTAEGVVRRVPKLKPSLLGFHSHARGSEYWPACFACCQKFRLFNINLHFQSVSFFFPILGKRQVVQRRVGLLLVTGSFSLLETQRPSHSMKEFYVSFDKVAFGRTLLTCQTFVRVICTC